MMSDTDLLSGFLVYIGTPPGSSLGSSQPVNANRTYSSQKGMVYSMLGDVGWYASSFASGQWLQMDLGQSKPVCGVVIQAIQEFPPYGKYNRRKAAATRALFSVMLSRSCSSLAGPWFSNLLCCTDVLCKQTQLITL